ncbi:hypothetical protein GCM10011505_45280 [Tistrella bauzanensis]|uniref:Antitoxin n=1 Tax=Tistrella bauzanensis TaxID=657419 RepID=A0ABQ1J5T3_9PROT|nr:prevent-host-death protein [Tistrella bauzanensis]GGB59448.1 hypothetical protein GCM10011505_45280 [Tistrella bauzanensis]
MNLDLPDLKSLPHQDASQLRDKWDDVVDLVHSTGSVAVASRTDVEADMVLLDADRYEQLVAVVQNLQAREQVRLAEVTADYANQLDVLRQPDVRAKLQSVFDARGRQRVPAKAGQSF